MTANLHCVCGALALEVGPGEYEWAVTASTPADHQHEPFDPKAELANWARSLTPADVDRIAAGAARGAGLTMLFAAAIADADPATRDRITNQIVPQLRDTEIPLRDVILQLFDAMPPGWLPTGEHRRWIVGLLPQLAPLLPADPADG